MDIVKKPAVPTLFVFENKPVDGDNRPESMLAKGRMCLVGTPRNMQQGVHYDSVYAATPGQDSIMLFNALVVYLKLLRQAFDVGNAYGWAASAEREAGCELPPWFGTVQCSRGQAVHVSASQHIQGDLWQSDLGVSIHTQRNILWNLNVLSSHEQAIVQSLELLYANGSMKQ